MPVSHINKPRERTSLRADLSNTPIDLIRLLKLEELKIKRSPPKIRPERTIVSLTQQKKNSLLLLIYRKAAAAARQEY